MQYVEFPEMIESANAMTIQKLLTTYARADRFCEGHLASMFENGHILALLRRLQVHRPENYRGRTNLSGQANCAEFAVAKRWQERKESSFDGTFRGCLGAIRTPENCLVFDNGDIQQIGRIP